MSIFGQPGLLSYDIKYHHKDQPLIAKDHADLFRNYYGIKFDYDVGKKVFTLIYKDCISQLQGSKETCRGVPYDCIMIFELDTLKLVGQIPIQKDENVF